MTEERLEQLVEGAAGSLVLLAEAARILFLRRK